MGHAVEKCKIDMNMAGLLGIGLCKQEFKRQTKMFIKSLLPRDRADGAYDDEYDGDDVLGKVVTQ